MRFKFAEPEEVARAILFLASDEASYITGQGLILRRLNAETALFAMREPERFRAA